MTSRAAFLPSPGDPYVLLNAMKYFPIWESEIDKLYININSDIEAPVIEELKNKLTHPKINLQYHDRVTGHGTAINNMLEVCSEDFIVLIEDDSVIFRKGIVDSYFKYLEEGKFDVIGSPRMSCSSLWAELAKNKFGLDYSGYGDRGPNYWPCFLWCKRSDLLKTDRNFSNAGFLKGQSFLNTILTEDIVSDTFAWATMQLRSLNLRFLDIPQYHCHPADINHHKGLKLGVFDGRCPYFHFGSLSSGIASYLLDENGRKLKERTKLSIAPDKLNPQLEMDINELYRRVGWWREAYEVGTKQYGFYVKDFSEAYEYAINNLIKTYALDPIKIQQWVDIYKDVING